MYLVLNKRWFFFCLIGLLSYPLTNAYGRERIISTTPSATEILFALGFGDLVVGVTNFCTYPPEATKKVHIGGDFNPDLEKISELRPTMAVVLKTDNKVKKYCRKIGVRIVEVNFDSISNIYDSILRIGEVLGVPLRAKKLVARIEEGLNRVVAKKYSAKRPRVLLVVYREVNRLRDVWVAGPKSFLGEILSRCGGINVFNDLKKPYARVSVEEILARNPDMIFETTSMEISNDPKKAWNLWSELGDVGAVRHRKIYVLNAPYMTIPGPRIVLIAKTFMHYLYQTH